MEQELRRREGELKKSFYRRMAQMRKDKWASHYRQRDDHYRFHFMAREEEDKTKTITKAEPRSEQRIRNRMAAQESRERHRCYVEQLERKAKIYDQLVTTQQLICKHCHHSLQSDLVETEEASLSFSEREASTKDRPEPMLDTYLSEEVIRIDNGSATTPFGIFFLVCVVAVLAIASLHSPTPTAPRLLPQNPIKAIQPPQESVLRNFAEYVKSRGDQPGECIAGKNGSIPPRKNLRSYALPQVGWTKVGEFICSAPEVMGDRPAQGASRAEQVRNNQEERSSKGKEWQRVEVSQCFRGIP